MNHKISYFLFTFLFCLSSLEAGTKTGLNEIECLSPVNGSLYNSKETNIIIRSKEKFYANSIKEYEITVRGTESGLHSFRTVVTDNNKVLLIKPDLPFSKGESVEVIINPKSSQAKPLLKISFWISYYKRKPGTANEPGFESNIDEYSALNNASFLDLNKYVLRDNAIDTLPAITTSITHEINKGYIFISNVVFSPNIWNIPYLLIINNYGQPIFYRRMPSICFDFKVQNGNMFTYYESQKRKFYGMDLNFNVVDSFYCGNGYWTDVHDLQLFENGYAYLMSYDTQYVNMSQLVAGGDTNAAVAGLTIQEIDENKNVVFQWRSWDHFLITDATHENLTAHKIDYVHCNSIEQDYDGNIIISSRHMDELTKINRQTGQIIWRLGGKHNQFTFTNDPIGFSHQHSARRLANGNLLLYDNGNFHSPSFSRAVEYKLDEVNKTATKVWEFRNSPDEYANAMGSVQRLQNGNTLIGWGSANPTITEVRPNGIKAFELNLSTGVFSYRAFRYLWEGAPLEIPSSSTLSQNYPNPFNSSTRIRYQLANNGNVIIKVYDILGQEVSSLVNEYKEAGIYYLDFESINLSSGIYFYKLVSDKYIDSRKMVLIK